MLNNISVEQNTDKRLSRDILYIWLPFKDVEVSTKLGAISECFFVKDKNSKEYEAILVKGNYSYLVEMTSPLIEKFSRDKRFFINKNDVLMLDNSGVLTVYYQPISIGVNNGICIETKNAKVDLRLVSEVEKTIDKFEAKVQVPMNIRLLSPSNNYLEEVDMCFEAGDTICLNENGLISRIAQPIKAEPPINDRYCSNCKSRENIIKRKLYLETIRVKPGSFGMGYNLNNYEHTGDFNWVYICSKCNTPNSEMSDEELSEKIKDYFEFNNYKVENWNEVSFNLEANEMRPGEFFIYYKNKPVFDFGLTSERLKNITKLL